MNKEKEAFSKRLQEAVRAAGYDPRPAVLERLFNTSYPGRSVTFQAVSGWLGGRSLPSQDKLQVLAQVLGTEPHYLRFGDATSRSLSEKDARWDTGLAPEDRVIMNALVGLAAEHKRIIRDLIHALAGKSSRK